MFDSTRVSRGLILGAVEDLGFEPRIVAGHDGRTAAVVTVSIHLGDLPSEFQELFAEAERLERPVLLDFTAPG